MLIEKDLNKDKSKQWNRMKHSLVNTILIVLNFLEQLDRI